MFATAMVAYLKVIREFRISYNPVVDIPPLKFSSPLKSYRNPIGKGRLPSTIFSGVMLNFTGVDAIEFPNSPLKFEMYAQNGHFGEDSRTKPPFGVTSAEVFIKCTEGISFQINIIEEFNWNPKLDWNYREISPHPHLVIGHRGNLEPLTERRQWQFRSWISMIKNTWCFLVFMVGLKCKLAVVFQSRFPRSAPYLLHKNWTLRFGHIFFYHGRWP